MQLKEVYQPIKKELESVEAFLKSALKNTKYKTISAICDYAVNGKGKRVRPALVVLSAKASQNSLPIDTQAMISIASAAELIHIASLIHDDVLDHAPLRHRKATINSKCGQDVSIALGDYLYSKAFELISNCNNTDILSCISKATHLMCEGQLVQICERDSFDILKDRYIYIIEKKTASLFAASCEAGTILSGSSQRIKQALKGYGLNFGIAFQIIDDCMDLVAGEKELGKDPGQDLKMGELTLPVLNLLSDSKDKDFILSLATYQDSPGALKELRQRFVASTAAQKTKTDILFYIEKAKNSLNGLNESRFKQSLFGLTDYMLTRIGF